MSATKKTDAVTAEVVAPFEKRFNAHVDLDDEPLRKKLKKLNNNCNGLTADEGVRLFAAASDYYVRMHLEGDIFNMNGSSTNFAERIYG